MKAASPFSTPPAKKPPKVKRDTPDEQREREHVRARDRWCVAQRAAKLSGIDEQMPCDGPLDIDHVRASGGLGMKSPTERTNLVLLCRWHHRVKTDWGKVWRPMLLRYLAEVEPS